MTFRTKPASTPPMRDGEAKHEQITLRPGEHKREPIKDPDPADSPLQVRA